MFNPASVGGGSISQAWRELGIRCSCSLDGGCDNDASGAMAPHCRRNRCAELLVSNTSRGNGQLVCDASAEAFRMSGDDP
jgi:hypothetical protein